jgi:hypothetical protein
MSIRKGGLKLALTIVLWGLSGVALVVLPGLLAHNPTGNTEAPVTSSFKISNPSIASSSQGASVQAQQPSTTTDFLVRLLIIMVPAIALSTLVGTWVSNRARRVAV